jgi:GTPase SAR1 family protein
MKKMLIRLSLVENNTEVYILDLIALDVMNIDEKSLIQTLESIEQIALKKNYIQSIKFENVSLYVNPGKDCILRIVSEDPLNNLIIEKITKKIDEIPIEKFRNNEVDSDLEDYLDELFEEKNIEPEISKIESESNKEDEGSNVDSDPEQIKEKAFKIGICGIGKAGKTSIKRKFFEKWTSQKISNIKPTIGLERTNTEIGYLEEKAIIFDFGGQRSFRGTYFQKKFLWKGIRSFIFVVDIQDPSTFKESKEYLDSIVKIIKQENDYMPKFSLFFHKFDPENVEEIKPNVEKVFQIFDEYKSLAHIFLTNVFDDSSNFAIIKTLFLSMPGSVLTRILENKFLKIFESELIPKIINLIDQREILKLTEEKLKIAIFRVTTLTGRNCGHEVENEWIAYMQGKWENDNKIDENKRIIVIHHQKYLDIKIINLKIENLPPSIIKFALNGMMRGITKALTIDDPKQIKSETAVIQWQLIFN